MPSQSTETTRDVPLFVDIDYTLLATDLLVESYIQSVKQSPIQIGKVPAWILRGKAHLKRQLAESAQIDFETLPYRREVVEFLVEEKRLGRRLIIATASDERLAHGVAKHLGIFDDILASDGVTNLKGQVKQKAITQYCQEHDLTGFAYIGDDRSDLAVWQKAEAVYIVALAPRVLAAAKRLGKPLRVFEVTHSQLRAAIHAIRPRQWVKNILVFVPLLVGHEVDNLPKMLLSVQAFAVFCLVASSVYIVNDMFDLQADRRHERKKARPFASGTLPVVYAPIIVAIALLLGISISVAWLPSNFLAVIGVYLVLNVLYTFWLKSKLVVDVILLSVMYNLRVFSGGVACEIPVSHWLFAFGMFIFTSLAFAKRHSELLNNEHNGAREHSIAKGRGYLIDDLKMISSLGPSSGLIAVLVFILYIQSADVIVLYTNGFFLLCIGPLLLYWIARLWIVAGRGELHEDPISFAVKDWRSWVIAALVAIVMLVAR